LKITREVKTGILALLAIALLIFGYKFLKGHNLLDNDRTFYVIYDNVEGLTTSAPVTINGMIVGKVIKIDFADKKGNLIVTISVNNAFDFSKHSVAKIYGGGLLGGKSLSINPTLDQAGLAVHGDTLKGQVEEGLIELVNDRLTPLQEKIETAIVSADSVLTAINGILSNDSRNNLQSTFSDLSVTMKSFKNTASTLDKVLDVNASKLNRIFGNLDGMSTNLKQTSEAIAQINVGQLGKNIEAVTRDFKTIASGLDQGKGTAGKLLKDDQLYYNLENASKQLEQLLSDLKLNPKRYVHFSLFGKKPGAYEEEIGSVQK